MITYVATLVQVLVDYWKDWKRSQADPTVCFKFLHTEIRGLLPFQDGNGWQAALAGTGMVRGLDWCDRVVV